jgi:hypothetical protein
MRLACLAMAGFTIHALWTGFSASRLRVAGMAYQAFAGPAQFLPAFLKSGVLESLCMRAVRPGIGNIEMAFAAWPGFRSWLYGRSFSSGRRFGIAGLEFRRRPGYMGISNKDE